MKFRVSASVSFFNGAWYERQQFVIDAQEGRHKWEVANEEARRRFPPPSMYAEVKSVVPYTESTLCSQPQSQHSPSPPWNRPRSMFLQPEQQ